MLYKATFSAGSSADYHGYEQAALWTDIVDIKAMRFGVVGLKKDGTVVSIPKQQSDTSVEASEEMASWKNIKAIETYNYLVYGLTEDGTVLTAGGESEENISGWLDVKYLITDYNDLYGLCEDGTIKTSGGMEAPEGSFLFYKDRLGIRTDGTVYEKNAYGEKDYYNWTDMQSIIKTMSSGVCFGLKSDGTIREYFNSKDEDTSPDEMKNLKSVQCVSYAEGADGLLAVTNSGNMYTYGIQMNVLDVQQYESSISWYNGYAALYEDGTFLYQSDWENEKRIDGVKQVAEMLTHQMWRDNGNDVVLYAYILLMEDGTVKRLGSGFDVNGFEYYKDVFEGYSDVESWNDIVQLEGWGL